MAETKLQEEVAKPHVAPRPNLPLPRNIRDKIWAYLLLGENVKSATYQARHGGSNLLYTPSAVLNFQTSVEARRRQARVNGGAHTYRFHTNILATNHEIHDEAIKVLLQNDFVVLSFYWPILEGHMHTAGVAIVTQDQGHVARFEKRFRQQFLRVHMTTWRKLTVKERELRSCLLLREDLEAFCDDRFWAMLIAWPLCPILGKVAGAPAQFTKIIEDNPVDVKGVQTKLQLPTLGAKAMTAEKEQRLLEPFQRMTIPFQKLQVINSVVPAEDREAFQQLLSPKCVSLEALAWSMAETVQRLKRMADIMVLRGDYPQAFSKYHCFCAIRMNHFILWQKVKSKDLPKEAVLPASIALRKLLDAITMCAFVAVRVCACADDELLRAKRDALDIVVALQDMGGCPALDTAQSGLALRKAGVEASWFDALCAFCTGGPQDISLLHDTYAKIANLRQWRPEYAEHMENDMKLVKSILDHPGRLRAFLSGMTSRHQLIVETSFFADPPPIFDTPIPVTCKRPSHLRGLQDVEHLERIIAAKPELAAELK